MQNEDEYARRRAYISRRRKQRKRQRTVRIMISLMVAGGILIAGAVGAWLFLDHGKKQKMDPETLLTQEGGESPETLPEGTDFIGTETMDGESGTDTQETDPELEDLLHNAGLLAAGYDYDGAIALLSENPELSKVQAVADAISSYEETRSTLVRADTNAVTHVFFHSLVMDNSKAFDGDSDSKGYNQVMTTKSEFLKILEQMYERGYVLVKLHDIAYEVTDENGNKIGEMGGGN